MPDPEDDPATARPEAEDSTSVIEPVTCLACGCLCDDLVVTKHGEAVVGVEPGCDVARDWFTRDRAEDSNRPVAEIDGRPASMAEAVERVARLLVGARAPVIVGLSASTNQTVAAAAALADRIGAVVDPISPGAAARNLALARAGRVSATLGEVKNRSDLVVFWGADPVRAHPRHWERYSVLPAGRFVPEGRAGRTVIVVDDQRTATAERADHFIAIDRVREFEILWALLAMVKGLSLDADRVRKSTGLERDVLERLASRLAASRYGALFHSPRLDGTSLAGAAAVFEAAQGLVRELNRHTRFVVLGMGQPGNAPGAEAVLTWQTGFPTAVDLGGGSPASLPGVTAAEDRLARGEADALLVVGEAAIAVDHRAGGRIATVVVGAADADMAAGVPAVRCRAATPGLDEPGTVVRSDGVALPLRPVRDARFPTEREWLRAIHEKIDSLMKT